MIIQGQSVSRCDLATTGDFKEATLLFEKSKGKVWSTFHTSLTSWAMGGLQQGLKWTDSGCHWYPCMLTSKLTDNMFIYNVKRARLVFSYSTK